jgi:hypothetical protein
MMILPGLERHLADLLNCEHSATCKLLGLPIAESIGIFWNCIL